MAHKSALLQTNSARSLSSSLNSLDNSKTRPVVSMPMYRVRRVQRRIEQIAAADRTSDFALIEKLVDTLFDQTA